GGVLHHPQQHDRDAHIKDGAYNQGCDDAEGQITLWVATLLRRRRYGVETNVGEEYDGSASNDSGKSGRSERFPVSGIDQHAADYQERKNGADFDGDHYVVGFRRLAHSPYQQQGQDEDNEEAGHVKISTLSIPPGLSGICLI